MCYKVWISTRLLSVVTYLQLHSCRLSAVLLHRVTPPATHLCLCREQRPQNPNIIPMLAINDSLQISASNWLPGRGYRLLWNVVKGGEKNQFGNHREWLTSVGDGCNLKRLFSWYCACLPLHANKRGVAKADRGLSGWASADVDEAPGSEKSRRVRLQPVHRSCSSHMQGHAIRVALTKSVRAFVRACVYGV